MDNENQFMVVLRPFTHAVTTYFIEENDKKYA
jgi:hypothetical protein